MLLHNSLAFGSVPWVVLAVGCTVRIVSSDSSDRFLTIPQLTETSSIVADELKDEVVQRVKQDMKLCGYEGALGIAILKVLNYYDNVVTPLRRLKQEFATVAAEEERAVWCPDEFLQKLKLWHNDYENKEEVSCAKIFTSSVKAKLSQQLCAGDIFNPSGASSATFFSRYSGALGFSEENSGDSVLNDGEDGELFLRLLDFKRDAAKKRRDDARTIVDVPRASAASSTKNKVQRYGTEDVRPCLDAFSAQKRQYMVEHPNYHKGKTNLSKGRAQEVTCPKPGANKNLVFLHYSAKSEPAAEGDSPREQNTCYCASETQTCLYRQVPKRTAEGLFSPKAAPSQKLPNCRPLCGSVQMKPSIEVNLGSMKLASTSVLRDHEDATSSRIIPGGPMRTRPGRKHAETIPAARQVSASPRAKAAHAYVNALALKVPHETLLSAPKTKLTAQPKVAPKVVISQLLNPMNSLKQPSQTVPMEGPSRSNSKTAHSKTPSRTHSKTGVLITQTLTANNSVSPINQSSARPSSATAARKPASSPQKTMPTSVITAVSPQTATSRNTVPSPQVAGICPQTARAKTVSAGIVANASPGEHANLVNMLLYGTNSTNVKKSSAFTKNSGKSAAPTTATVEGVVNRNLQTVTSAHIDDVLIANGRKPSKSRTTEKGKANGIGVNTGIGSAAKNRFPSRQTVPSRQTAPAPMSAVKAAQIAAARKTTGGDYRKTTGGMQQPGLLDMIASFSTNPTATGRPTTGPKTTVATRATVSFEKKKTLFDNIVSARATSTTWDNRKTTGETTIPAEDFARAKSIPKTTKWSNRKTTGETTIPAEDYAKSIPKTTKWNNRKTTGETTIPAEDYARAKSIPKTHIGMKNFTSRMAQGAAPAAVASAPPPDLNAPLTGLRQRKTVEQTPKSLKGNVVPVLAEQVVPLQLVKVEVQEEDFLGVLKPGYNAYTSKVSVKAKG